MRSPKPRSSPRPGCCCSRICSTSSGRRYRLPGVVLLIATGIALRQVLDPIGIELHWIEPVVPVLGTIGLILIVLEGALDLT